MTQPTTYSEFQTKLEDILHSPPSEQPSTRKELQPSTNIYSYIHSIKKDPKIEKINASSDEYINYIKELTEKALKQLNTYETIPHSNDSEPNAKQLITINANEIPLLQSIDNMIKNEDTNIKLVDSIKNAIEHHDTLTLSLLREGESNLLRLNIYYTLSRKKTLKKKFFFGDGAAISVTSNLLTQAPNEDDWLFMTYRDIIIISHKGLSLLNQKTSLRSAFEAKATLSLEQLKKLNIIDGFELFKTACLKDFRITKKLCNIYDRNHLSNLTITDITSLKQKYSLNKIVITNNKVVYSNDARWEIIKILNDDLLISTRTNANYVADAKSPV